MILFEHFYSIDARRRLVVPGHKEKTITFMTEHWVALAQQAITEKGAFYVALSGGSTPKAIFEKLKNDYASAIDWNQVHLFFSDERAASPDDPDSNYHMAMTHGFASLNLLKSQIHRMVAEKELEKHALEYEELIKKIVPNCQFDLVMLGMGEDGHTASLFPQSQGLHVENRLVIANYIPSKKCHRMTMTFPCINRSKQTVFYVLGASKSEMVKKVLTPHFTHQDFPATLVGSEAYPALWILDHEATKDFKI